MKIAADLSMLIRPIADLKLDPKNARKHSEKNIASVVESLRHFGQRKPIVITPDGVVIAGNGTLQAAKKLGAQEIACTVFDGTPQALRAFAIADNRSAELAEWDEDELREGLEYIQEDFPLVVESFDFSIVETHLRSREVEQDELPAAPKDPITKLGDVWILGAHRLMCGDSTHVDMVKRLVGGHGPEEAPVASIIHADPPYGMGKASEGVQNDNLYREKLDAFQMAWWRAWRPYLAPNGSAYIWGNAPDLWRLWYAADGLNASERLTFRNEIVWDKRFGNGMNSEAHRQFATVTERCLFFMLGEQGFGNLNVADYFEGFEPIRLYLEGEAKRMGLKAATIRKICGVNMYGHWFTKSQWTMIPKSHYETLAAASGGTAFQRPYAELRRLYDGSGFDSAKEGFYALRAYFDNTHDTMSDVWTYDRVLGEDRYGHATPKPVPMIARALVSSSPKGALVLEPFGGSGTTLIAAEQTERRCYAMELTPAYCDVTVQRWEKLTGQKARLAP
jgi:DNA modification methylase